MVLELVKPTSCWVETWCVCILRRLVRHSLSQDFMDFEKFLSYRQGGAGLMGEDWGTSGVEIEDPEFFSGPFEYFIFLLMFQHFSSYAYITYMFFGGNCS